VVSAVPDDAPVDLADLVRRAAQDDAQAARTLFDQYHPRVFGYCVLSTDGDRDAARDVAQEVFIKAFRNLDSLRDPAAFGGWLWTIVHRECSRRGKRRSRYAEVLGLFDLDRDVMIASENKAERELRIACVRRVLEGIEDERLREIVTLKYTEPEHTAREIAEKLGIPRGTVTVKLMRFRDAIEDRLLRELRRLDLEPT
jgi:RNA polymerase sigma-70 factor (ECF subfamily)